MIDFNYCPGAKQFRQPKPEIIRCSYCGNEVEIWSDEIKTRCPICKSDVFRNNSMACLAWCKFAKQCVGEAVYRRYLEGCVADFEVRVSKALQLLFKDKVRNLIKEPFQIAQKILLAENASPFNLQVVLATVSFFVLEDKLNFKIDPDKAMSVLNQIGLERKVCDEVRRLLKEFSSWQDKEDLNYRIVHDTIMLFKRNNLQNLSLLFTSEGKMLAKKESYF